jgi:hypothetical protein
MASVTAQRGAFGIGEVGGVPPGDQGEQPFVGLAVFLSFGRSADAYGAAIHLAGTQVH